jgi:hypothetical protein
MRILLAVFLLFQLVACNFESKKTEKSINEPTRSESVLKDLIMREGDQNAYYELKMAYLDYQYTEEFLLYAMTMANKCDYAEAYFDVYSYLIDVYYPDITKIDEKSANLAIDYLIMASDRNWEQAQEIVKKHHVTNEIADKRALIIKINKASD